MTPEGSARTPGRIGRLADAYALRWKRRRLLWRAFRARHGLVPLADRTARIRPADILAAVVLRNEADRLPHFLDHLRRLGVAHVLAVDNASTDGSAERLAASPDVSVWQAEGGYKAARFGMDWIGWLLARHGHGHWCLTVDADETLIYPYWETRDLRALTGWLEAEGRRSFGALMVDLYPAGPPGQGRHRPGDDPARALGWLDAGNHSVRVQPRMGNLWIQGGVRSRAFFAGTPRLAPTLNKVPLIRWNRRFAYVNSTHSALPPALNRTYAADGGELASGVLLHAKLMPQVVARAREEKRRREHFRDAVPYDAYYDALIADRDLWCPASTRLTGWRRMEALGLMSRGGWI